MSAILKITDGMTEIVLTSGHRPATASGLHRATLDRGWLPQVAEYKGGGVWQDSPLADNRTLASARYKNVAETIQLNLREACNSLYPEGATGPSAQDLMIRTLQEIRRLLEKAASYWTGWHDEPVYLVAKSEFETNTRYAILYKGGIPEDKDPYFKLFERVGDPMMLNLTCVVERGHWMANVPGTGVCVEASGQKWEWEREEVVVNTALPAGIVNDLLATSGGSLLAGDTAEVWRTTDGTVWNAATTPPAGVVCAFLEASDGNLYCATTVAIYRSTDDGRNWVQQSVPAETVASLHSLTEGQDGYLYMANGVGNTIERSNDWGRTWTEVYPSAGGDRYNIGTVYAAEDGYIYAGTLAVPCLLRSANGTQWDIVMDLEVPGDVHDSGAYFEPGDGYLYAYRSWGAPSAVFRSGDGVNFVEVYAPSAGTRDFLAASDGYYYACGWPYIYQSRAGTGWEQRTVGGAPTFWSIEEFDGRIYLGADGDIYEMPLHWVFGQEATCDDQVYVSNKENIAQLTDVWVYDSTLTTYTARSPSGEFPFDLFPSPVVNGDMLYCGINSSVLNAGPFFSLVFDLSRGGWGLGWTVTWQYSDGGGGWPALRCTDGTFRLSYVGVNSIHWVPQDATTGNLWAPEAVNGVTALWVRAVVGGVDEVTLPPQQDNRDIYTVVRSGVSIDAEQVPGDIPALLRFKFRNRSDDEEYAGLSWEELDLLENRVIAGLRSDSRGLDFTPYLNCSDVQNPIGVVVSEGTGTAIGAEIKAPTGRSAVHTTQARGLTNYDTALTIELSPDIAQEYYGIYHAYLRAQLYEPESSPVGDHDDVRVRLRVRSGSGGVSEVTQYRQFVGWDEWGAGEEESFKDWQLLDFGQVDVPATGLLKSTELPDQTAIVIEIASAASTELRVDLYDVILMPVDEWAGDFVDNALEDDSGVGHGYRLDVDSLAYPKRNIRALVRTADTSEFMRSVYQPITNGPAMLQSNADQRLWFLTARGVYEGQHDGGDAHAHLDDSHADFIDAGVQVGMTVVNATDGSSATITAVTAIQIDGTLAGGTNNDWDNDDVYYIICPHWKSEPWNCHSVQLSGNSRYFSMRGDR